MINTNLVTNLGQTILDSSQLSKTEKKKLEDPEEDLIIETFESDCEQCEIEKLKKPCSICEPA